MPDRGARLDRALVGFRWAGYMMLALGIATACTLVSNDGGLVFSVACLFFAAIAYRYGQTSTLLEIKGLRRSDCPVLQRWFGFYSWYLTAPDHRKDDSEPEFARPPGPSGDAP